MYKVDGITKYVKDSNFKFDNTFNENENSQDMYQYALKDILPSLFNNGIITVFAYGQTGSGKTFTINQITKYTINDIFKIAKDYDNPKFMMSLSICSLSKILDLI